MKSLFRSIAAAFRGESRCGKCGEYVKLEVKFVDILVPCHLADYGYRGTSTCPQCGAMETWEEWGSCQVS